MVGYLQLILLGFVSDAGTKQLVGDMMVFFICFNIGFHLFVMLKQMAMEAIEDLKDKWAAFTESIAERKAERKAAE